MKRDHLLQIPVGIGRTIVEHKACFTAPLLSRRNFVKLARDLGLNVDEARLIGLETNGMFAPVFRVRDPDAATGHLTLSERRKSNAAAWFDKGWASDATTGPQAPHGMRDETQQAYYSRFQIPHLSEVLTSMSLDVHLEGYLTADGADPRKAVKQAKRVKKLADAQAASWATHEFQPAMALLCQYISNRYYPHALSNGRTMKINTGIQSDNWILVDSHDWDWHQFARSWDARETEQLFALTPARLKHAYKALAAKQAFADPLEKWQELVQFVNVDQRKRLKGGALYAQAVREGAIMLRLLHRDLYGEELTLPHETMGQIIHHVPELEARKDTRRHLELIANKYDVNPQPKLVLLVEGRSEEIAAQAVFTRLFGADPGKYGIEIVTLGGVSAATGGKQDRYRAIFRLIDYLHSHQTLTFLLLDREGSALALKHAAKTQKSIHGTRFVTRADRVKIWRSCYEFDNFSATEIARALTAQAEGGFKFTAKEVNVAKNDKEPGAALKRLFKLRTARTLDKQKLAQALAEILVSTKGRRKPSKRPFVRVMKQIASIAGLNPLPTTLKSYAINQASPKLAKQVRRRKRAAGTKKPATVAS